MRCDENPQDMDTIEKLEKSAKVFENICKSVQVARMDTCARTQLDCAFRYLHERIPSDEKEA